VEGSRSIVSIDVGHPGEMRPELVPKAVRSGADGVGQLQDGAAHLLASLRERFTVSGLVIVFSLNWTGDRLQVPRGNMQVNGCIKVPAAEQLRIQRRPVPGSSMLVAKLWRSVYAVTRFSMPALSQSCLNRHPNHLGCSEASCQSSSEISASGTCPVATVVISDGRKSDQPDRKLRSTSLSRQGES
jgi:hypothetical protein